MEIEELLINQETPLGLGQKKTKPTTISFLLFGGTRSPGLGGSSSSCRASGATRICKTHTIF